jgi:hypothetical protein
MYKKITVTAKEVVANVKDGAKTVEVPQKYIEVELIGVGENHVLDPFLFKYNEDSTQILETFSKFFGRPVAELSSATEVFYINAAKVFAEFQIASDNLLLIADWIREFSDDLQSQVTIFANFGKVLTEQPLAIDTVVKSVVTNLSDSNLATDTVASAFQTSRQDTSATNDSITLLVDFRPVIQDWVHMTDDVLGTVEGDQNKVVAELRTVGEELSSALDKLTSDDAWSINDIAIKSVDMPLKDFLGVPDVLGKSLVASKADATVMSDACTANLQDYMSALYVNVGYIGFNYTL